MDGTTYHNVAEIEADKVLYRVMLQTLDPEAEDYEEKSVEFEENLSRLDRMHAEMDPTFRPDDDLSTPSPSASHLHTPSSELPSRTRPPADMRNDSYGVSSQARSAQDPYHRKRPRELSDAPLAATPASAYSARKSQRTALNDDSASSSDSHDEAEEALTSATGGFFKSMKNKFTSQMLQAQRDMQDRYRRERQDAEMARQLSMQEQDRMPSALASSSRNMGEAISSPAGRPAHPQIAVGASPFSPARPAPNVRDMPESNGHNVQATATSQPHAPPTARVPSNVHPAVFPSQPVPSPALGSHRRSDADTDSEDGFSLISADEFRRHARPSYQQPRSLYPTMPPPQPPWAENSMPGSTPGSISGGMPGAYPGEEAGFLHPSMRLPNPLGSHNHYPVPTTPFGFSHGLPGSSVYGNPRLAADSFAVPPNPTFSAEQISELRDHGMLSMLQGGHSNEEILQLLDNIRPDEEIPAELRLNGPPGLKCRLMEHQKLGLSWLKQQEEGPNKGSILADDMGLGKTVQAIALMLERKPDDPSRKTTLIVAPLALMRQWAKEIETKVLPRNKLSVYTYHANKKQGATWALLSQHDVVLTTYGAIASEWRQKSDWTLCERADSAATAHRPRLVLLGDECLWHRVILDEAQVIKNRNTKTSTGASFLKAKFRLCMSGTPMMNNVEELFSLIRFLRIPPYNTWEKFNKDLVRPIGGKDGYRNRDNAMQRLQAVIKAVLLRRTKSSTVDGKPILVLPERVTEVKHAVFDADQRDFYDALEKSSQVTFNKYLKAGTVNKNYTNALVLLLRLRQCCDHPHLIKDHAEKADIKSSVEEQEGIARQFSDEAVAMVRASNGVFECPICYDAAENPTIFFPCGHDVCAECFTRLADPAANVASGEETGRTVRCPECRQRIQVDQIISYNVFKRVRLPDMCGEMDKPDINGKDMDSSSDDSSDSSDESDTDSQGDLRDFIVPDDEDDDYVRVEEADAAEDSMTTEGKSSNKKGKRRANLKKKGKNKKTLAELKKLASRSAKGKEKYLRRLRAKWVSSAKLDKTMEIIKDIRMRDAHEKTIIFSQFTTFLDLLEVPIDDEGLKWARYDGSMSPLARNEAVDRFEEDKECNIMLISLKAGNAGLNLNWASQVIILDPFWNPFVEEQAIDRAHRIGQQRPVTVHRVLVQETVEDRILILQEQKRALVSAALDETAGKSLSRLGANQLAYLFGVRSNPNDGGNGGSNPTGA